ncbi:MAG: patatin-like phospholipase family protein [Bacteroidota bacterium]
MKNKFYILAIDGGGLKGLIAIKILQIIEDITKKKVTDSFDLISGTSTGGLIACALAVKNNEGNAKHDLSYVENMYLEAIQSLLQNGYGSGKETMKLSELITRTVERQRIADTYLPVFVPTYDLNSRRIVVFKTRSAILNENKNIKLFDVCRATSAVPQIFPSHPVRYDKQDLNCADAGWHIKNPAIAAVAEVWKHKSYYSSAGLKEEDIVLISISTGNFDNGKHNWTTNLYDILPTQYIATDYITHQKLDIDLSKLHFLRVDLNFSGERYSFKTLMEIGNKIESLSQDTLFKNTVKKLFE